MPPPETVARLSQCSGMTPERAAHRVSARAPVRLPAGEREDAGVVKALMAGLGQAAEDDAASRRAREDSASGGNLEGPPGAGCAGSALDGEPKGVLPITRECEPARSDHTETACSRRSDDAKRKPGLDGAESGQLARPAERIRAAGGVLQVRLEGVHAWRDRYRGGRGEAGQPRERTGRDGEESQRKRPHGLGQSYWDHLAIPRNRAQDAVRSPGPVVRNDLRAPCFRARRGDPRGPDSARGGN